MTYVEWLRVRNCLKILAIVFAVLLVLAGILRIWAFTMEKSDVLSWIHSTQADPASRVTKLTLPDGTRRTIIESTKQNVRIVVDNRGYEGEHVEILERSPSKSTRSHNTIAMGPLNIESRHTPEGNLTVVDTNQPENFAYYAAIATFVTLIVATILGAPFARENDGHLEIALTKPIAREPLALATIGVDALGMLGAWVMTIVFLTIAHTIFAAPHLVLGPGDGEVIGLGFLGIAAWYAMLCAATTSLKRAYGVILGLAWPIALVIKVLAGLSLSGSTIGQLVHVVVTPLSWIDPFTYVHFGPAYTENGQPGGAMTVAPWHDLPALVILALVYGALAVAQWRRVEA